MTTIEALGLAVSMIEQLEHSCPFNAVPGNYPMDGLDKLKQHHAEWIQSVERVRKNLGLDSKPERG